MAHDHWVEIKTLGEGGQATVYLVHHKTFTMRRLDTLSNMKKAALALVEPATSEILTLKAHNAASDFVEAIRVLGESPRADEIGALKVFKIRDQDAAKTMQRLGREIEALRHLSDPHVIRLLDANPDEQWMVTEYHPKGTLCANTDRYAGNPRVALEAFRPLVAAVANLHKQGLVHRDIKPDNLFVATDGRLVLGDFGIVLPLGDPKRVTDVYENVGSRDWMPGWAYGMRLEEVTPKFDVFGLGKVLWAMASGKTKMTLWYFTAPQFDLQKLFPDERRMQDINAILSRCVVEQEKDCLPSANELLQVVDETLTIMKRGSERLSTTAVRTCRVCGRGQYASAVKTSPNDKDERVFLLPPVHQQRGIDANQLLNYPRPGAVLTVRAYCCDKCGHIQLFWCPDGKQLPAWQ